MSPLQSPIDDLKELIAFPSVSTTSNREISDWVAERLEALGFQVEQTRYSDHRNVEKVNVVGRRDPVTAAKDGPPGFAYFAHTDVVPADEWTGPGGDPFAPVVSEGRLYGRGSCDMKGSLATMLSSAEQLSAVGQRGPLWIVCTADEEVGFVGAKHMVKHSAAYRDLVAAQPICVIGEPTELKVVHAHKGIVGMRITSHGRAAHSSTSDGVNANLAMVPMLQTLLQINERTSTVSDYLDQRFDPPTLSWNFGVSDHCSAINVTPGRSVAWVSFRPMPKIDGNDLVELVQARADELGLDFERLDGGAPLWIDPHSTCIRHFCELAGGDPIRVCYGTDGGELTELKNRVVIGPGSVAQAHTTDEWIELDQLSEGIELFTKAIDRWCA